MPVLIFLLILLAFPILEIWVLIELFDEYGWLLLIYLIAVGILGWRLVQDERKLIIGRFTQNLTAGVAPAKLLFGSAKNIIAGILLMVPGLISDAFAVLLLLIPAHKPLEDEASSSTDFEYEARYHYERHSTENKNADIIEGEYKRED